jgi:hypothetical protein
MHARCASIVALILMLLSAPALAQPGSKKRDAAAAPPVAGDPAPPAAGAPAPLRLPLAPLPMAYYGAIDKVHKSGAVQISPADNMPRLAAGMRQQLTEGYYLGVVCRSFGARLEGARLVRAQVTEVGEDQVVQLQVANAAAEAIEAGEILMLVRPSGASTARMKQLPDVVPLVDGAPPGVKTAAEAQHLARSFNNLKQMGLALHNFHDVHRHFPPAFVIGPDGKPWHSWRVLLLPYLDQAALYTRYRFDEPWDGPRNKPLLEEMPAVFSDPVYGENREFYTHYAAVTGDDMAFTAEGTDFDGRDVAMALKEGRGMSQFTDGTSNTLLVGPVGPDRQIPWMKPEDILVDDKFPDLGKKGGFAAPYKSENRGAAPFLRCDGSVAALLESIDRNTFHALLTLDGGEPIGAYPSISPSSRRGVAPVIYIVTGNEKTVAYWAMEPLDEQPEMIFPGAGPADGEQPGFQDPFGVPPRGRKKGAGMVPVVVPVPAPAPAPGAPAPAPAPAPRKRPKP